MPISRSYKTTLVLPFVENVHNVLIAFLRTAESGEWKGDAEKPSDQFVMHFIRGRWRKAFVFAGGMVPAMHELRKDKVVVESLPMRLKVKLLPSPQDLTIMLEHEVYAVNVPEDLCDREAVEWWVHQWDGLIGNEVASLRAYLKKCYNLPDLPRLVE